MSWTPGKDMRMVCPLRASSTRRSIQILTIGFIFCAVWYKTLRASDGLVRLTGHVPLHALSQSRVLGHLDAKTTIPLAVTLPLTHTDELKSLLQSLYDPKDPLYGHYLTPDEFTARFGPSQEDYDAVISYGVSHGLTLGQTFPGRTLVDFTGTANVVENTFGVHMVSYQHTNGHRFYAPDAEPMVPEMLASKIDGITGFHTANVWHKHLIPMDSNGITGRFSGPSGGLSPNDIKTAYNLLSVSQNGTGQTIALFELDGFTASDITAYEKEFNLPAATLQIVTVDNQPTTPGSNADEVTLDIDMVLALAPSATKVLVYETPNSSTGVLDAYTKIAADNLAKNISTSWGTAESQLSASFINSENTIFTQMAAQGQSIYAAAGDSGAYDDGATLSTDDPGTQPGMVSVGGTHLNASSTASYVSESTWNDAPPNEQGPTGSNLGAGGGGISSVWAQPSYQKGVVSTASLGSQTKRNVPDVSLNGDPVTGYSVFVNGSWHVFGGTSAAAPLWAGFNALVNQSRASSGLAPLGFPNTRIYAIAKSTNYSLDFHDIADHSTNLFYPAVTGYDCATGWGSFNGAHLLTDLASNTTLPPGPTPTPTPPTTGPPTTIPTPTTSTIPISTLTPAPTTVPTAVAGDEPTPISSSTGSTSGGCNMVKGERPASAETISGATLPLMGLLLLMLGQKIRRKTDQETGFN